MPPFPHHPNHHHPNGMHHPFGGQHSQSSQLVVEALEPVFGQPNALLVVRGVEGARPPEAGAKLIIASSTLLKLVKISKSIGVGIETKCGWLAQPLNDSHPHAFAYNLIYSPDGISLLEGIVPTGEAESIRYRLTHGPWEIQSLTMIELAIAYLTSLLLTHLEQKDPDSMNGAVDE